MTDSRGKRINARIDGDLDRKLNYLRGRTKQGTTAVVREAIERYHKAIAQVDGSPAEVLERNGLIGQFDGPSDLSLKYKGELRRSLVKKT